MIPVFYIALCILVALFAIGQRGGFLLYFILSLLLTPIIGLVILLVAGNLTIPRGASSRQYPPAN